MRSRGGSPSSRVYAAKVSFGRDSSPPLSKPLQDEVERYFRKHAKYKDPKKTQYYQNVDVKEDKFSKIARNRGRPTDEEAAHNRLLHGGYDADARNRLSEYNYNQIKRDHGRSTSRTKSTEEVEAIEYPERISITLDKVPSKKPLPFFFTDTARDQTTIEVEGSDDDPESRENQNDDDSSNGDSPDDKRLWERLHAEYTRHPKGPNTGKPHMRPQEDQKQHRDQNRYNDRITEPRNEKSLKPYHQERDSYYVDMHHGKVPHQQQYYVPHQPKQKTNQPFQQDEEEPQFYNAASEKQDRGDVTPVEKHFRPKQTPKPNTPSAYPSKPKTSERPPANYMEHDGDDDDHHEEQNNYGRVKLETNAIGEPKRSKESDAPAKTPTSTKPTPSINLKDYILKTEHSLILGQKENEIEQLTRNVVALEEKVRRRDRQIENLEKSIPTSAPKITVPADLSNELVEIKKYLLLDETVLEEAKQALAIKNQKINQLNKWILQIDSSSRAKQLARDPSEDGVEHSIEAALDENHKIFEEIFGEHSRLEIQPTLGPPKPTSHADGSPKIVKTSTKSTQTTEIKPQEKDDKELAKQRERELSDLKQTILSEASTALSLPTTLQSLDSLYSELKAISTTQFNQSLLLKTAASKEESFLKELAMVKKEYTKAISDKTEAERMLQEAQSRLKDIEIEAVEKKKTPLIQPTATIEWEKREKEINREREEYQRDKKNFNKEKSILEQSLKEVKDSLAKVEADLASEKTVRQNLERWKTEWERTDKERVERDLLMMLAKKEREKMETERSRSPPLHPLPIEADHSMIPPIVKEKAATPDSNSDKQRQKIKEAETPKVTSQQEQRPARRDVSPPSSRNSVAQEMQPRQIQNQSRTQGPGLPAPPKLDQEIITIIDYCCNKIVGEGNVMNPQSAETIKRIKQGPYADKLKMLDRLLQMQNSKLQVMFEIYRGKFLNDNLVLHEIQVKLQIFSKMLDVLESYKSSSQKKDPYQVLEALMKLKEGLAKKFIDGLVEDTVRMQVQNEKAVRDAVSGDIVSYLQECNDQEPYSVSRTGEEENSRDRDLEPEEMTPEPSQSGKRLQMPPFKREPSKGGSLDTSKYENLQKQKPQKRRDDLEYTEPRAGRPIQAQAPVSDSSQRQSPKSTKPNQDFNRQFREELEAEGVGEADPDFMQMLVSQSKALEENSPR
jgi:hypothetical protein